MCVGGGDCVSVSMSVYEDAKVEDDGMDWIDLKDGDEVLLFNSCQAHRGRNRES